ncbi:LytR/AlgR family response regulator transcription factor [Christiangramia gaetbulicola]|uniref:LytR/AlgR family response regulator transcription factor n=1 Tax=Christiangramia gaetbulicola TaxID=703340 RepID=UPI0011B245C6|nr:LytTR family DNA-binding domain-containing protein [Christiangramia gaetbulicola]
MVITTYIFNFFLVPRYLLKERYGKFILYFIYLIIASLYLEMLVALFSFVMLAKTSTRVVSLEGISIFTLGIMLYLIVFATSFVRLVMQFQKKETLVEKLQSEKEKNEQEKILIRADRKNHLIDFKDLYYIESLNDYVKILTSNDEFITREKITSLNKKLPDRFLRIHRSFIINMEYVTSFTTTSVDIKDQILPISRTYKKDSVSKLQKSKIAQ